MDNTLLNESTTNHARGATFLKTSFFRAAQLSCVLPLFVIPGCAGTIIGTAADAAIAVAKIPVKVGGAVVDAVTPDEDGEEEEKD